ncbi:cell wall metabolism sensor histidine kinase WalK [Arthrobacter alpinus]|uniref:sensor histidine kinase n=1 Tax=Arthrobacter alpinus TaxID=656366 RepID=UPI0021BD0E5F|nr:ATP-binding protein [Arthrobacter alpinus]
MTDTPANQFIGRFFYQQPLRTRVILAQLPFSLTVALAVVMIAFLYPSLLNNPQLVISLWLNGFLLGASILVPWDKLPRASFLVIPYLDFVAVAFFREGIQALLSSAGVLVLFPIFWICASGFAPKTAVISSTVASLLIVWNPIFQSGQPTPEALIRPLLFPFMMLGFAIAVVLLTSSMNGQRATLEAKDRLLHAALTESQKRERLLETIVDTVGVGVVAVDAQGNDLLMNATQAAIHALGRPHDIADPREKELLLFAPDWAPLSEDARPVRRAILGESFTNYQIWIGAGEQARALSTTARTIHYDDNTTDGAVIAFHDVTDMVNALAAKDDFVANVSHEFRTPLTAIQSYLALALETPGLRPQEVEQYLEIAERNAQRLAGLVSDLLTTASLTVERAPKDVARLLADSLSSAAPAAAANAVTVESHCQEPLLAMVDGVRISQVLDNLVSNAVKYSPDGGTLTVRAWADGTDLHCQVKDTGLGMNTTERAGVFTKFFRAGSALERGIPGIGLGLMISKTIIDTHGGTLTMDSEPGAGTTMSFVIPACVLSPDTDLN